MNRVITMLEGVKHRTQGGQIFHLRLKKKELSVNHNYWLYFIEADHESWGRMAFWVFVTKQAFPDETLADQLAQTLAMDEAKSRLEDATAEGRPMLAPFLLEGWGMM